MTDVTPIFAKEATAAKLMDMTTAEFRKLVRAGHLPPGREIAPGFIRWSADDLRAIVNGDAGSGMRDVKW